MSTVPQSRTNPEAGYILLAVLFLVALILLSLAVAAPRIAKSIQRDKELELIHRGEQYTRAIKLYYRKFGNYPSSIDQLENTNNIRFLRKRYTDPMTGKDDWKIIHFGQAHVKTLGLFGQPVSTAGSTLGAGPGTAGAAGAGGIAAGGLGSSLTGSGSITSPTTGTDGSTTSGTSGSGTDGSGTSGGSATSGTNGGLGTGGLGTSGFGTSGQGTGGSGTGASGNTNPTFGGGPIVGIAIPSTKASIKEYKQQKHYNEWEFVYDPVADQLQAGTLFGGATQNLNGQGTTNGTNGTFGNGIGNTSGGGIGTTPTGGTGSGGTGSPTPPTQQQ
jgi:type II secretory pathway pseudopilin PulG